MGMIDHGERPHLRWFPAWKWSKDPNLVISALFWHIFCRRRDASPQNFPKKLFLQADNAWAENKNRYVLAFLFVLVMKGIFAEVEMHFLMKGHTHEDVDRMFSFIRKKLQKLSALTVEALIKLMEDAYGQQAQPPEIEELKHVWDWKTWLQQYTSKLSHHTDYRAFRFSRGPDGKVMMQVKKSGTDAAWSIGVELVPVEPPQFPRLIALAVISKECCADTQAAIKCLSGNMQTAWQHQLQLAAEQEGLDALMQSFDWNILKLPSPNIPPSLDTVVQPPLVSSRPVAGREDIAFAQRMFVVTPADPHDDADFWIGQICKVTPCRLHLLYMCPVENDFGLYQYEISGGGRQSNGAITTDEVLAVLDEEFAHTHRITMEQIAYFEYEVATWRAGQGRQRRTARPEVDD